MGHIFQFDCTHDIGTSEPATLLVTITPDHFQLFKMKVAALDPNFSKAYFPQSVSHEQLGEYSKVIAQINWALRMEP